MLNFDADLQATLNTATSKLDWCNKLVAGLGSGLKVRCKRSPDPTSTTVFTTGTEFYNATIVGAPTTSAGSIVKFGNIINATIQAPADLSTGASVLRIEGATHWMEATLGLTTSSSDFKVTSSPSASTGLAFTTISISAPRSLPSGSGSVAPDLDANAPAYVELEDWSDPANPVLVGSAPLDTRAEDFVYQDSELAAEIGDVRITQSSSTIIFGRFEFGVTMFTINGTLNLDNPGTPVHQVVIAHKPHGTWPSYPFADTFRKDRDLTFPKPYKLKIRKSDSTILKTIEMRDGLAVNDPSLAQTWGNGQPKPLRPHMECGQWHFWQSAKLKYSSNALKYFPGVTALSLRPSIAKNGTTSNAPIAFELNRSQWNSTLQWYAAPEWPIAWFNTATRSPDYTYDDDPFLFIPDYHGDEGHASLMVGWNIEPGSISLHDWFIGPGGPRHDRSTLSTPLVRYFTDPNGVRLKGNVPHRTLLDCYNHGYFHHSHHMLLNDVKTFKLMPKEYARDGSISFSHAYYGQNDSGYVPGGLPRHVGLWCIPNGGTTYQAAPRDGHAGFLNGWEVDDNHSYIAPGLATMFCNSPAHTVSGALRFFAHVCGQLGSARPESTTGNNFLSRVHAWRMHQLSVAWKTATTHSMGIDRETIEQRFQRELEAVYDTVYVPAIVNQSTDISMTAIRRFGQPVFDSGVSYGNGQSAFPNTKWWRGVTDSKAGYFAGVLTLMRQTGCWAAMRARSTKCDVALRFIVDCMDKDSLMSLYYTKGRYEGNFTYSDRVPTQFSPQADAAAGLPDPVMYADWNEWVTKNPANGQTTLMTDADGSFTAARMDATTGLRLQWAFVRRDYFPDIPSPLGTSGESMVDSVCTMAQGWLEGLDTKIKSISSPWSAMSNDMAYYYPPHGVYLAPTVLGPF